jgi:hypothetical protein
MGAKADVLRKYADEYRKQAESAANSADKEHWREMAARCMKMADAEEAADNKRRMRMMPYYSP